MKIVTFNIRSSWNGSDGINSFIHRAGLLWEKIRKERPDVIAFQEVIPKILELLTVLLPEYRLYGQMRSETYGEEGLFTAVRTDSAAALTSDTFWLSPTPYVPGSRFPMQSIYPRICVVTQILDRTSGRVVRVYNVHLDYETDEVARLGMACVLEHKKEYDARAAFPSVILGDFNAEPGSPADTAWKEATPHLTDLLAPFPYTYHGFGKEEERMKIDYICADDALYSVCTEVKCWDDCTNGIWLSDHYPFSADFDLTRLS